LIVRRKLRFEWVIKSRAADADRLSQRQGGPKDESLPFSAYHLNRLVREAVSGFYLLRIKFPDPDRPFTALDPATMPWLASANTLGCEGNALYLDVDTYRLLTRRASNSKMTE
jgi:hypothetical protein